MTLLYFPSDKLLRHFLSFMLLNPMGRVISPSYIKFSAPFHKAAHILLKTTVSTLSFMNSFFAGFLLLTFLLICSLTCWLMILVLSSECGGCSMIQSYILDSVYPPSLSKVSFSFLGLKKVLFLHPRPVHQLDSHWHTHVCTGHLCWWDSLVSRGWVYCIRHRGVLWKGFRCD